MNENCYDESFLNPTYSGYYWLFSESPSCATTNSNERSDVLDVLFQQDGLVYGRPHVSKARLLL